MMRAGGEGREVAVVRRGRSTDAAFAAGLHAAEISTGFLSSLGPSFLKRLYRRIACEEGSFLLIAEIDDTPIGFIAGSVDVRALYRRFVFRDGIVAGACALGHLLRSIPRALETLRHGLGHGAEGGTGAELLSVAVDQKWRGHRAGASLVAAFFDELHRLGSSSAHVVVGADNDAAIAMYRSAGFAPGTRYELHPGTWSLVMQWSRDEPPQASDSTVET